MRRPIVGGNWKMHLQRDEAVALATAVRQRTARMRHVDIVLFPPYPYIEAVRKRLEGSRVAVGAQDCHTERAGAFTGAVSAPMLASVGCTYVLCGHSERRRVFGDTDAIVRAKLERILEAGMTPVLCIGETEAERDAGRTEAVLGTQLEAALGGLDAATVGQLVVAYEPVWAIGTGRTATPSQAQDAHAFVRAWLVARHGDAVAQQVRIQYGGSVKPGNVDGLMAQPDIDGALVGGASLDADSFVRIVCFERRPQR